MKRDQLMTMRDMGGEDFKDLNALIDTNIPDRVGKNNIWNSEYFKKLLDKL